MCEAVCIPHRPEQTCGKMRQLFEKVLPGDDFKKEAYITNTGSYEQYIRVVMTITDWKLIENLITINMQFYKLWRNMERT